MKANIDVNQLYAEWVKASPEDKENCRNRLGEALYFYLQQIVRREFKGWRLYLEDAIGESAHDIFKDIHKFNPAKGVFSSWVYGVTHHTCTDLLRRRNTRKEQRLVGNEPFVKYESNYAKLVLDGLRKSLSKEDDMLIDLKLQGLSNDDIASELNTTVDAVKSQWKRLCERLRTLGVEE